MRVRTLAVLILGLFSLPLFATLGGPDASAPSNADLAVTGTAAGALDAAGQMLYSYTVTNGAASAAQNVHFTVLATDFSTFASAQGANCQVVVNSFETRANCTMADIPANQSASFTVLFKASWPVGRFSTTVLVNWGDPALHLTATGKASALIYAEIEVNNTNDSGSGSLRAAINTANAACTDFRNPCRIRFRIPPPVPASGWFTITPQTALPAMTSAEIVLDAEAQTALTGDTNPRGPEVELSGASGIRGDGLVLAGAIHTVRGLAINGFRGNGILVAGANSLASFPNVTITGNDIGTDPTGEWAIPNFDRGIRVVAGEGVIQNNVISGNGRSGIFVDSGIVSVLDNRIGVSSTGAPLGNGASGIFYGRTDASLLVVGEVRGNVIANNRDFAVAAVNGVNIVVRENSMHDNGRLAYDVGLDGVSPTPFGSAAGLVERPLVTAAHYDAASGDTIIDLLLNATPPAASHSTYTLYLFASSHLNRGGYAEGETFLAKVGGSVGQVRLHSDLRGQYITVLTERFVDFGDLQLTASSELSDGVLVP